MNTLSLYGILVNMRIDEKLLTTLLNETDPISGKQLAFILGVSEKTVQKYLNILKDILADHGAAIMTKQRVGSYIVVHDSAAFNAFLSAQSDTRYMDDPVLRQRYVLTRLILTDDYINIYDLAEEISISPSLARNIIKELHPVLQKYDLAIQHSHFHGYMITGEEPAVRRCIAHECKASSYITTNLVNTHLSKNAADIIHRTIAEMLEHFNISVSSESINSLTLHVLIAINRIETHNTIQLDDAYKVMKIKAKPEYFAALQISKKLESALSIHLSENELVYLTTHISGQQRLYGHEQLHVSISEKALLFYNRFLRNILQFADEDFFNDEELRTSLLNHIVPFISRLENNMQIEKSEINNIKTEFPYAYDLAVYGLSSLKDKGYVVNEIEISYFALHLQLSLEKRKEIESIKYNVLVYCEEASSIFHMLSYKLSHTFKEKVNEVVFTSSLQELNNAYTDFHLILNTTDTLDGLPQGTVNISPFMNEKDVDTVAKAFNRLHSKVMGTVILRKDLFFDLDAKNKEDVFCQMSDRIHQAFALPSDFLEQIRNREALSSTELDNRIAIPHPLHTENIPSFMAVARLSRPILWDTKQVQLVFMICNNGISNPWLYTKIVHILQDAEISQKLLSAKDFDTFKALFETI